MSMEIQAALDVGDETDSFLQITDVIYDKEADVGYFELKPIEKLIFCIDSLLREMENGGFTQFLRLYTGDFIADSLLALEQIKAKATHALLQQCVEYFPNSQVSNDDDEREQQLDQVESEHADELSALDDRFYDSGENLVALTLHYVQRNLKEFR